MTSRGKRHAAVTAPQGAAAVPDVYSAPQPERGLDGQARSNGTQPRFDPPAAQPPRIRFID